ncbi:MAG TPA: adenylate/guanylate cyclase domain-containing protein [Candidatus Udaeobacter sp.]|nr:adenylate/guanylate cyclase domain-containing protein [Candidatus Udaeobacter sp.]
MPPERPPEARQGPSLPITNVLLAGFGGLIALAVVAVMLLSLLAAQRNTDELLAQTAGQRLDAALLQVDRYLQPVADDVDFLAQLLSQRTDIALTDGDRIQSVMEGALGAAPQIVGIAYIRPDLTSVRARRSPGPRVVDTRIGSIAQQHYGPELIEAGKHTATVVWNRVFYVKDLGVSFISALAPVRRGNAYDGVVVAAVPVAQLSSLIDSADSDATMFILNASDEVVAHPELARGGFTPTAEDFIPQRLELHDPVLRQLWSSKAGGRIVDVISNARLSVRRIETGGTSYIVLLRELDRYSPLPWIVGIYFPATELTAPLVRLRLALGVGIGILAFALALAFLLGRSLARPIRRLALAAEAVSNLDFSGAIRIGASPFREIAAASRAWDAMLQALGWFEIYVPKLLVSRLVYAAPGTGIKAEEREVTVMFTDIAGFSAISKGRKPSALAAFLNRHFALIGRQVEAAGGTIDKYIGDSVMAFWGAPAADERHAEHGARAALAVAEGLKAENLRRVKKGGKPIRIRIGLHTGRAIVGNVGAPGRINYTLIGDTVNAAQRLEQAGKDVDREAECIVLASAATVYQLPADIPRQDLGHLDLRGVGAYEIYRLY